MKRIRLLSRAYGLHRRFLIVLAGAAVLCMLVFCILYEAMDYYVTNYFEKSGLLETLAQKQGESLQEYILENEISSQDIQKLGKWERKQPLIFLEVYLDGKCIYSSFYDNQENSIQYHAKSLNKEKSIEIRLADAEASAVLSSDFAYQYYWMGTTLCAVISLSLFIFLFLQSNRKLIRYICRLNEEVQILEGGNLEYQVSVEGNDEITDLARSMNRMSQSFRQQMETEQKLHLAYRRLITEMSHDLRTPLTGILLYLEILKSHRYSNEEELHDFLEKIDEKAQLMKRLSDQLFERSLEDEPEEARKSMDMEDAFARTIDIFRYDLITQGFTVSWNPVWDSCCVLADEEYIRRIFENLSSNILKYADPAREITIEMIKNDDYRGFSITNTKILRTDTVVSSGIGIENIRAMMSKMNGKCMIDQTETLFSISLLFRII